MGSRRVVLIKGSGRVCVEGRVGGGDRSGTGRCDGLFFARGTVLVIEMSDFDFFQFVLGTEKKIVVKSTRINKLNMFDHLL